MARAISLLLAASCALFLLALGQSSHAALKAPGHITVIQAVPGVSVDVAIDGKSVSADAGVGAILGPFDLAAGAHTVTFTAGSLEVESTIDVSAGASTDVVLHLPAEVAGDPVVHSYDAPTGPIGPDKARVVLAHTATVAPADVRVNGQTVFTNIANGEYAEAELPSGTHEVALLPTGQASDPILGPVSVVLESRTLSMIYAYGNPRDGSMNVIRHTFTLSTDGTVKPTTIETGSAGSAADLEVTPFSAFGSPATG